MSLLEDVFLEDEAGEAQELERVIEGDEFDERPRSRSDSDENSAKEDEAEEDKRRVDPTSAKPKRVIKNPRFVLNPARLTGPRGIQVVTEHFKDFKFKGKGHEREDLDLVLKKLEHWAYRLYPKFQYEDCLKKIETLGKKRAVAVHLHRIRTDQITSDDTVVQKDSSDDEVPSVQAPEEDEFDKLLQQQIEIARATPAPSSAKKTPFSERSSMMPKATSSPSISDEQRDRMLRNRRMAEERRLARLKQTQENVEKNDAQKSQIINVDETRKSIDNSDDDMNKSVNENHDTNRNVIMELDDAGIVVTKSVKTYVAKNKSRIDLSEDATTESVTIDIQDSNSPDIVELDNDGKVVTKSPKNYVTAKKHNKSRIDSSDDENDLVINEPITVDVDKHHEQLKKTKNIFDKSYIDSSDSDEMTSKTMSISVENHHNGKKHNRSNIIDSSDSEDEAVVVNESIIVDIHDSNPNVTVESSKTDIDKIVSVFDSLRGNTEGENSVMIDECNKDIDKSADTVKNISEINDNIEIPNIVPESSINISKTTLNEKKEENVTIMDVDFSDDF